MAVVIETTLGDLTVDLFTDKRPKTCLNFLKLCKLKYYNFSLFHTVQHGFIAQTGDPSGEGTGGQSVWGILEGSDKRYFECEKMPRIKHTEPGLLSMVASQDGMVGSQFFFTLASDLNSLDAQHCVIGEVTEGHDVLRQMNEKICDAGHRPYQDVRITHTVILEDPFNDPTGLQEPSRSPSPTAERLRGGRIAPDEEIDETVGKTEEELVELVQEKEAKARATILEIVGDLPDAEMAPPENVLFVCKLNPVTSDDDLEIIFSRFGKIVCCEVIRDKKSGDSLQYAFIEFDNKKSCEDAYLKMDNVLIDDRRIHVDFSQSVSKIKWQGKGRGVIHLDDSENKHKNPSKHRSDYDNRNRRMNQSNERDGHKNRDHARRDNLHRQHSDDDQNKSTPVSNNSKHRRDNSEKKQSADDFKRDSSRNDNRQRNISNSSNRYKETSADHQKDRNTEKARKASPETSSMLKNYNEKPHDDKHGNSNNHRINRSPKIKNDRSSISNHSPDTRRIRSPNNVRTKSPEQRRNQSSEHRRNQSTEHRKNNSPQRSPDVRRNRSPRNARNRSPEYKRHRVSNTTHNPSPDCRINSSRDYRNRSPGRRNDSKNDRSPDRRLDRSADRQGKSSDYRNDSRYTENNSRIKSGFNDNVPSTSKNHENMDRLSRNNELSYNVREVHKKSSSVDHNSHSLSKKSGNLKDLKNVSSNPVEASSDAKHPKGYQQKSDDITNTNIKTKKRKTSSQDIPNSQEKNESPKKKQKSSQDVEKKVSQKKNGHKKVSKSTEGSSTDDDGKLKSRSKNSKRKMKKKKYSSSSSDTSSSSSSSDSSDSSEAGKKKKKTKKVVKKKKVKRHQSSSSSSSSDSSSTTSSSSDSSDSSDSGHERSRKKSKNKKSVREKLVKKKSKK